MQYITLLNDFNRWLETNPLDPMAQLLMFKFLDLFNRSGWQEWVSVDNLTLMSKIKVKREASLIAYRDKLLEAGLLAYHKGKKGSPNRYKLTMAVGYQSVVKSGANRGAQVEPQRADPNRIRKDKDHFFNNNTSFSKKKARSGGSSSLDITLFEGLGLQIPTE